MTDGILRSVTRGSTTTQAPFLAAIVDPFDSISLGYSFRKLRTGYAGSAVRIRRGGDNAEADIGFDGNGDFDVAAAATHIAGGAGGGFIVTWYDQSVNGINVTNATAAAQPEYVASAISGLPACDFVTVDDLQSTAIDLSTLISTQGTIFSVMLQDGANAQNTVFGWTGSTRLNCHATYDDVIYFDFGSTGGAGRLNVAQPSGWDDNPHVLELYRDSGDSQNIVVDGVTLATGTRTDDITTGSVTLRIGQVADIAFHAGYIAELVIWGTDLAGSRASVRTNINNYWSVF